MNPKTIVVFSNPEILAINLIESLLIKGGSVYVISVNSLLWAKRTLHLKDNNNLKIVKSLGLIPKYLFPKQIYILEGFYQQQTGFFPKDFLNAIKYSQTTNAEVVLVEPHFQSSYFNKEIFEFTLPNIEAIQNYKLILVGDIYGPRMNLGEKSLVEKMIKAASDGKTVAVPPEKYITPVFIKDVVIKLHKLKLSGEITNIISSLDYYNLIIKALSPDRDESKEVEQIRITINWTKEHPDYLLDVKASESQELVAELVTWYAESQSQNKGIVEKPRNETSKKKNYFFKSAVLVLALLAALSPFFSIFVSSFLLSLFFNNLKAGEVNWLFLNISQKSALFAKETLSYYSKIPFINQPSIFGFQASTVLADTNRLIRKGLVISNSTTNLLKKIFGSQDYDIVLIADSLKSELDDFYDESSFLLTEIDSLPAFSNQIIPDIKPLLKARAYINESANLIARLPILLGQDKPKTYLVLFQNNTELRPTGGFIGSLALITFNKGKLMDMQVFDVYSADGQLKGHVEPPLPIKKYLGEANWFLRDANWDPDFAVSSEKIEWFLDKELERSVDGVVGVDLEFVKDILTATGPVKLNDFNVIINEQNLYEKTQSEVESNFFPGSRKKANFLSSLSKELLFKLKSAANLNYLSLGKSIVANLEEKHIQIFLHDSPSARVLAKLGWDGGVSPPTCPENCLSNWFGLVEANVGVNKSNSFIARKMSIVSQMSNEKITNTLKVELNNKASPALGSKAFYKTYVRLISPTQTTLVSIQKSAEELIPESLEARGRRESGVLVEVLPGQRVSLEFVWELPIKADLDREGEYVLFWRKQAGTGNDPISVKLVFPPSLTPKGDLEYNDLLSGDYVSRINW